MKARLPLLLAAAVLALPGRARAQDGVLGFGVHVTRANDLLDGATGVGGQIAVRLPALPVTFRGAVDRFFPDCPEDEQGVEIDDCGAWGFSVDANVPLPMPVLRPYASGGLVRRAIDLGDPLGDSSETGLALGAGLELNLLGLGAFGEGRYEIFDEAGDGWVFRVGVVF